MLERHKDTPFSGFLGGKNSEGVLLIPNAFNSKGNQFGNIRGSPVATRPFFIQCATKRKQVFFLIFIKSI